MAQEVTSGVDTQGPMTTKAVPSPAADWRVDFDDLSDADKVERLRNTVKEMQDGISYLRRQVEKFERHEHNGSGKMMVPLRDNRLYAESSGRDGWL